MMPAIATRKLGVLERAVTDSEALVRSTMSAVEAAQTRRADFENLAETQPSKAEAAEREIAALEEEIERLRETMIARQARAATERQVLTQCQGWLQRAVSIEIAPTVSAAPDKGETIADAIKRVREQIGELTAELYDLRAAPLTRTELRKRAAALVDELSERGRPVVMTERGEFDVRWRRTLSAVPGMLPTDVAAMFAWYDPDTLVERLLGEIPDAEGVSAAERERREPQLEAQILELERVEEALIEQTSEVARRPDANPAAILGVTFVAEAQAA
jgi:hypothetical protein